MLTHTRLGEPSNPWWLDTSREPTNSFTLQATQNKHQAARTANHSPTISAKGQEISPKPMDHASSSAPCQDAITVGNDTVCHSTRGSILISFYSQDKEEHASQRDICSLFNIHVDASSSRDCNIIIFDKDTADILRRGNYKWCKEGARTWYQCYVEGYRWVKLCIRWWLLKLPAGR